LDSAYYGVNNSSGTLSGFAWSENAGWIKFDDSNSDIIINATTGDFDGYTLNGTTLTILDGQTTGTATFTIVDDSDVEGAETATLTLTISSPSTGITLGSTTTQNVNITDNDSAPPPPASNPPRPNHQTPADRNKGHRHWQRNKQS
jgi:hypothetical protein